MRGVHAVIHNVGIGDREKSRVLTADGLSRLFAINVVAPYLLTAPNSEDDASWVLTTSH
jgi:short-subunit dehydrogenase